jgi:hypothetical protein
MAALFDRALYFIVANRVGTTDHLITTQTRPARVRLTGAASSAATWSISSARLFDSAGGTVVIAPNTLKLMFSVGTPTSAGGDYLADVSLVKTLAAGNATLMGRFLAAGFVELDIQFDTGLSATLTLDIRAFKSSSFLLNSNTAEVANYAGVPAGTANFESGDALANYTFQVASAFDANLAPTGTAYTASLTTSGAAVNLVFPTAGTAPSDLASQTLLLKVSHTAGGASLIPMVVHVPTDFIVLLDRSGSMGVTIPSTSTTKWDAAVSASDLFSKLYGELIQKLTVPGNAGAGGSTLAQHNKLEFGHFTWTGATPVAAFTSFVSSDTTPAVPSLSPGGGTPIGEALKESAAQFTADKWRRRHILLLTDGADNAGTPRLNALSTTDLPPLTSTDTSVVVHVVSYALTGDTQVVTLSTFATDHGGQYHDAAADNLNADALRTMFLSILADVLPVNRASPLIVPAATVEEGVERAAFVATRAFAGTLAFSTGGTGGTSVTDNAQAGSSSTNDISWTAVDNPSPGTWTATAMPSGADVHVLYDLALRMRCGVEPQGLGRPIKVWTELRYHGEPLSGIDVRVGTRAPAEALGDLLTTFVQRGGLGKALQRGLISRDLFAPSIDKPRADAQGNVDVRALQRLLLDAAEEARNLRFLFTGGAVELREVSPGRYEGTVTETHNENAYNFYFRADGLTPEGNPFTRDHRLSAVLAPAPSQETSDTTLVSAPLGGGKVLWTATVFPRTVLNKPVGPGLANTYLSFGYTNPADRTKYPPLVTRDQLDGSYSTALELAENEKVPPFGLYAGPLAPGATVTGGVVVKPRSGKIRKVRVVLDRIKILNDHDGIFTGKGELAFDAVVAPNGNPHRAVRTRIPERGVLKLASGEARDLKTVLYEGLVEHDAQLSITIGGSEFDYFLFFQRKEKLARYHRSLPLKSAHLAPGDEPNDPEALRDWQVWYTLEVE